MAILLLISDTHGSFAYNEDKQKSLQEYARGCDAVICMGDIYYNELVIIKTISEDCAPIFGIPGNHEPMSYVKEAGISNIHGKLCHVSDVSLVGFGGSLKYKDNDELCMMTEDEAVKFAKTLPTADILISHSPYKRKTNITTHSGYIGISWYIENQKPAFHFYGHLHDNSRDRIIKQTRCICIYQSAIIDTNAHDIQRLF